MSQFSGNENEKESCLPPSVDDHGVNERETRVTPEKEKGLPNLDAVDLRNQNSAPNESSSIKSAGNENSAAVPRLVENDDNNGGVDDRKPGAVLDELPAPSENENAQYGGQQQKTEKNRKKSRTSLGMTDRLAHLPYDDNPHRPGTLAKTSDNTEESVVETGGQLDDSSIFDRTDDSIDCETPNNRESVVQTPTTNGEEVYDADAEESNISEGVLPESEPGDALKLNNLNNETPDPLQSPTGMDIGTNHGFITPQFDVSSTPTYQSFRGTPKQAKLETASTTSQFSGDEKKEEGHKGTEQPAIMAPEEEEHTVNEVAAPAIDNKDKSLDGYTKELLAGMTAVKKKSSQGSDSSSIETKASSSKKKRDDSTPKSDYAGRSPAVRPRSNTSSSSSSSEIDSPGMPVSTFSFESSTDETLGKNRMLWIRQDVLLALVGGREDVHFKLTEGIYPSRIDSLNDSSGGGTPKSQQSASTTDSIAEEYDKRQRLLNRASKKLGEDRRTHEKAKRKNAAVQKEVEDLEAKIAGKTEEFARLTEELMEQLGESTAKAAAYARKSSKHETKASEHESKASKHATEASEHDSKASEHDSKASELQEQIARLQKEAEKEKESAKKEKESAKKKKESAETEKEAAKKEKEAAEKEKEAEVEEQANSAIINDILKSVKQEATKFAKDAKVRLEKVEAKKLESTKELNRAEDERELSYKNQEAALTKFREATDRLSISL